MRSKEEVTKLLETFGKIGRLINERPDRLAKIMGGNVGPVVLNINHLLTMDSLNSQQAICQWALGDDTIKLLDMYQMYLTRLEQM